MPCPAKPTVPQSNAQYSGTVPWPKAVKKTKIRVKRFLTNRAYGKLLITSSSRILHRELATTGDQKHLWDRVGERN